jgi:hypothetical protein
MQQHEIEPLLFAEEGLLLDFKRSQYPFSGADELQRSELLKDILGFANCERKEEALILIGVEDIPGGRAVPHGVTEHLHDHSLQQFVNSLTNKPLTFVYEASEVDGVKVGVIRIAVQPRPFYLKRDYGKLKKNEVYVRRGSSTNPSKPASIEEIARMGCDQIIRDAPSLSVVFSSINQEAFDGNSIEWVGEYCEMPSIEDIPDYSRRKSKGITLPNGRQFSIDHRISESDRGQINPHFYRELSQYLFYKKISKTVCLAVKNQGECSAKNIHLEIVFQKDSGVVLLEKADAPRVPKKQRISPIEIARQMPSFKGSIGEKGEIVIEATLNETKALIDLGDVQPGRTVKTQPFDLAIGRDGTLFVPGRLFADNLSPPIDFNLTFNVLVTKASMTVDELCQLQFPFDDTPFE